MSEANENGGQRPQVRPGKGGGPPREAEGEGVGGGRAAPPWKEPTGDTLFELQTVGSCRMDYGFRSRRGRLPLQKIEYID